MHFFHLWNKSLIKFGTKINSWQWYIFIWPFDFCLLSLTVSGSSLQAKKSTEEATYPCMKWMGGTTRWAHLGMLQTVYSSVSVIGLLKKKVVSERDFFVMMLTVVIHCWSLFADLLSESLSTSKTIPRPQDTLFWCGAFYFLHPHWSQQTGSAHRRLLLQSKACFWCFFLSKVDLLFFFFTHHWCWLYPNGNLWSFLVKTDLYLCCHYIKYVSLSPKYSF